MSLRYGLHARLLTVILAATVITLAVVGLILQRQGAMQREMLDHSRESMHALVHKRLADQGRATVERVAEGLVNPLYYFDLEAIGQILATIRRQPDVSYVVVYSPDGDVLHDGSQDIMSFGQAMDDPFAAAALAARAPLVQFDEHVLDIAVPISLADERLGGLRVGYSLQNVAADEQAANEILSRSLEEISGRHLQGVTLSLAGLVLLGVALSLLAQRALVRPIRQLAGYAREIETGNFNVDVADSRRRDEIGDLVRTFRRMSESIRRHDRDVRRMAYTDALTGLSNRLAFREVLDQRLIESGGAARGLALLFADIDDFKRVNDTLGHDAGDEVLVQFSERIRDTVERFGGGATLSRFGGDEFVILLEGDERGQHLRETASLLAGVLVEELSRPIVVRERPVHLGISVGITLFPDDAGGATALMKNGDIAMYQAKVAGKNCYRFYSRAMDQAVERRVQLEQDLRGAWDRGELTLAYQPVFDMRANRLVGAEVLLRWQHPKHGMVAPSVFIEVAEQGGLIETLGPQVLRIACRDAVRWRAECGQPDALFLAVNVSPRQLRGGDFAAQVEEILAGTGHPPSLLHLELTETAVIGDELRVSGLLGRLRARGVKVWLDDFGTGFSGLSHLRRVPIDGVKIDRSFIAEALRNPDDLALTTAIIAMAHSLGMTVVAEGVETEGQADLLRERGCDYAQGYWLGHPMPLEDLIALCR
ncbi:putative bifunctional diguanylate cyclase/phosphodiesterase [Luteimonas yindakuii]|uniref:putative bifunctional diguanylate cyclase/phosphodiesterase n=1 Tax=Luteimonas yindakuii TaxID=2565782 RepID=UPI001FCA120E|nr:GGDEF domain-containing phosphodiesterase [Luteimonas yindakuii]